MPSRNLPFSIKTANSISMHPVTLRVVIYDTRLIEQTFRFTIIVSHPGYYFVIFCYRKILSGLILFHIYSWNSPLSCRLHSTTENKIIYTFCMILNLTGSTGLCHRLQRIVDPGRSGYERRPDRP